MVTEGERIRARRVAKGWTQLKLAQESGVRNNRLSLLERDLTRHMSCEIEAIAKALGFTLADWYAEPADAVAV